MSGLNFNGSIRVNVSEKKRAINLVLPKLEATGKNLNHY